MKKLAVVVMVCASVVFAAGAWAATVPYNFQGTASYQFGAPADLCCGSAGGPDTGFITMTNAGTSTFSGQMGFTAVSGFGVDFSSSYTETLNPGDHVSLSINSESSNQGGYGGAFGTTQTGATFFMNGTVTQGASSQTVALSINDADIHSGVFQTNPFGVTLDNYVLQGGDPLGRDTGDSFETAQAPGTFSFVQTVPTVPEPGTLTLLASALISASAFVVRPRKSE